MTTANPAPTAAHEGEPTCDENVYVYRVTITGSLTVTASSGEDADRQVEALYGRELPIGFGVDGATFDGLEVERSAELDSVDDEDQDERYVDPLATLRALRTVYDENRAERAATHG